MSSKITIEVIGSVEEIKALKKGLTKEAKRVVKDTLAQGVVISQQLAPVRSGALKESITATRAKDGLSGEYGPTVAYAKYVNDGTKGPYVIRAKNAKALRFKVGGKNVFRKSVVHPGIKGQHFMEKSAKRIAPAFQNDMAAVIDRILDK